MVRRTRRALRRAARWYAAGLTAAASQLVCPELMVHLDEDAQQSRYARAGIEELTAWLRGMPIID